MTAIAAVSGNWGIGKGGDLLFHIPEDMKFFRMTTLNHN
ncbi:MAG: dihydrofolate reductase, partial [Oscillospiraceae bacterium]|nr:dihydrofolate reductase [Oscillospiraceae bacterium]